MMEKQEDRKILTMPKPYLKPERVDFKSYDKKKIPGGSRLTEHDKELKRCKEGSAKITLRLMSGEVIENVLLLGGDKYSVKVRTSFGDETYFKHAIESFYKSS